MNYFESVLFLDELGKSGSEYGLASIYRLLHQLGNPQDCLKVIHVAGTNGKGTVTNILSNILHEGRYKVGLFNSPNILSYTETIKVNQCIISEADFAHVASTVKNACKILVAEGFSHPTVFECFTAIALTYFQMQSVDFAIIEVGLGGALDATNVFTNPLVTVITSISFDHMEYLGATIEEIAQAKAGIIKNQCPVVLSINPKEVLAILFSAALRHNCPTFFTGQNELELHLHKEGLDGMVFSIETPYFNYKELRTKLIGPHQLQNICTALTVISVLREKYHYTLTDFAVKNGLEKTYWPCRCEYLIKPIPIIMDGAHNEASLDSLLEVLKSYSNNQPITFLFGVLKDKDVEIMLKKMSQFADTIFTTMPLSQRALSLITLQAKSQMYFKNVEALQDPYEAFEAALSYAKKANTLLCCVGSLYLSIPLRAYINNTYA